MPLFKKKDKGGSPAPQAANPYAQAPINPYQQAKSRAYTPSEQSQGGSPPPPYDNGRGQSPGGPPAAGGRGGYPPEKQNPYASQGGGYAQQDRYGAGGGAGAGGAPGGGYGANAYGGGGYGNDRYGGGGRDQGPPQGGSKYGAGGYGGMSGGGASNPEDEPGRNALFGGGNAQQRQGGGGGPPAPNPYAPGAQSRNAAPSRNPYDQANPTDGGGSNEGWGAQPAHGGFNSNMSPEEEEEAEVQATRNEIRQIKQQDVSSTRNALRMANRAEEVGRDTLARLGAQGESLFNAEKSLDLAHNHNKRAEEKARELKTLNRSMFAVHVSNPFTSKSRQEAADQAVVDRHLDERGAREATRRAAYLQDQRMQKNFAELDRANSPAAKRERNLAERAKYQFEADSDDEEMENEIDANLDALSGAAGRLNALARATGKEVDAQNERLINLGEKSDKVDVGLAANHARINRIK